MNWILDPEGILASGDPYAARLQKEARGAVMARSPGMTRTLADAMVDLWVMTWLYTMTFGSFIGYSAAFPKLIQDVFGSLPDGSLNPNAPNPLAYAWIGPLVGSIIRPVGGWLSDKLGGARVTQWDTVIMVLSALGVAYYVKLAGASQTPVSIFHAVPDVILASICYHGDR